MISLSRRFGREGGRVIDRMPSPNFRGRDRRLL
jgi:hypothetical protein